MSVALPQPPRVALLLVAVGDLTSSGGAERQFSDLHEFLRRSRIADATLITARTAVARLQQAGRLLNTEGVIALPLGRHPARGKLRVLWLTTVLLFVTVWRRFDVVHVCLPTPSYVPFAALLSWLPASIRPRIVVNVIDCTLAQNLTSPQVNDVYEQQVIDAHRLYFRWVRLDGVFTWYRAFVDACRTHSLVDSAVVLRAARYCFTDPQRFVPADAKEKLVVFAGRLSEQKRPTLFVDIVSSLRARYPELTHGWRFEMYGGGPLEAEVLDRIRRFGLSDVVALTRTPDLAPVFARSRVFVSTQALENFTSLAMLEAMAAGNVIVAEDVGQTREFVRPRENGFLASGPSVDAFVEAMTECFRATASHEAMGAASRRLATQVHTVSHFAEDIAAFWQDVIADNSEVRR